LLSANAVGKMGPEATLTFESPPGSTHRTSNKALTDDQQMAHCRSSPSPRAVLLRDGGPLRGNEL